MSSRVALREVELGALAMPETPNGASVVMIHDVWGLSEHTEDLARRLAGEGFSVLAIDLYRRFPGFSIDDPGAWMRRLSDPQALSDIQEGVDSFSEFAGGVGIVGFCMGGMYALMAAASCHGVAASVPFYGLLSHSHGILFDEAGLDPEKKPRSPLSYAADVRCPLLAYFGAADEFVPPSDVEALESELDRVHAATEVVVVPGAGHAFMNDTRPDAYRAEAASAAWARTVDFLRDTLLA